MPPKYSRKTKQKREIENPIQAESTDDESHDNPIADKISKNRSHNFQILLTIVSVLAAIASGLSAVFANKQAQEANNLMETSISQALPDVEISNWNEAFYALHKENYPCVDQSNNIFWRKDLLIYVDFTNKGGRTAALQELPAPEEINTLVDSIHVMVVFNRFKSVGDFDQWVEDRGTNPLELSYRDHTNVVVPINIGAGETRRVVLQERIEMHADPSISPPELLKAISLGTWIAHPTFLFSNETIPLEITLWTPYAGTQIKESNIAPFDVCQN